MKRLQRTKAISVAVALLLIMQLLLGVSAYSEGVPDGSVQSPDSEPVVGLFASGGTSGVLSDITNTEYLLIHGTSGTNPTSITIKDGATTLLPDASGNYSNVPTGATLAINLGFELSDGDGDRIYDYDGTEYFTFQLPEGITYSPTSVDIKLGSGSTSIATGTITGDTLTVQFNSAIAGNHGIWGYVKMTGTFDSMSSGGEDTIIQLGSQTITITRNPTDPLPPVGEINLGKTGAYDPSTNQITWTVTVTPSSVDQDISGYKIVDTYSANQVYVAGSFKVGSTDVLDADIGGGASPITYVFPADTKGTQVITYRTSPSGAFDFSTQFNNQAVLRDPADALVKSAEKTITLGTIIKKEGTNIQPDGQGIINWTVTVKLPQASDGGSYYLPNARIIDNMDSKLSLITDGSRPIQISFDGGSTYTDVPSGTDKGEYSVSVNTLTYDFPADQPYTGTTTVFKYSTMVTDWNADMMDNDPITFMNNAKFEWMTNPGGLHNDGSGSAVSIGTGTVTKTAGGGGLVLKSLASGWTSQSAYDRTSTTSGDYIKWKIVVNSNKVSLADAYITDAVQSGHELVVSTEYPLTVKKNSETAETYNSADTLANGTLSSITSSSFRYDFIGNPITDTYTIEYYTQLNDAGRDTMYAGTNKVSASKVFQNKVTLNYGIGLTADSSATKTYTLEMLNKAVKTGYNIGDHTVKWQLVVNRNMLPMTSSSVSDTVEDGMVIDYGKPISIKADNGSEVTLTTSAYSGVDTLLTGALYAVSNSDKTLTVTLPPSTSSQFTITYWTRVTDDRLIDTDTAFWGTNKQHTFTNTATLQISGKTDITTTSSVTAKNPVISKSHDYNASNPYEIINWTAVVNPAQIALNSGVVTDTLNGSIEPVAGSVKLYSTAINASGNPTGTQTQVALAQGGTADGTSAAYTYSGKVLTVSLPTPTSSAYVLKFQTVISDDATVDFTNSISLAAGSTNGSGVSTLVDIHEITAIGGMYSNSITVHKTDGAGHNLKGAVFALLNKNGNPVKRMEGGTLQEIRSTTDDNGNAVFDNLPSWVFYVKEIEPPAGYLIDSTANMSVNGGTAISGDVTVDATDTFGKEDVVINKTGAGGALLSGGTFTLTGKDYALNDVTKTASAANGIVTFVDVPIGTGQYTIKETAAPDGHLVSAEEIKVTVGYNAAKTAVNVTYPSDKTIENTPIAATSTQISFKKADLDGNAIDLTALGGAFILKGTDYKDNSVNKSASVSADGTVSFSDVTISKGKYQIFETVTPTGYLNPNDSPTTKGILDVEVKYNSTNSGLVVIFTKPDGSAADTNGSGSTIFKNAPAVGDVTFQKISSSSPSVQISGGNFKISGTTIDDTPYEAYSSAVNGVVTFADVPVVKDGTSYTITETAAPAGYLLTALQLTAKVEYTDATKTAIIVTNPLTDLKNDPAPITANTSISVIKTDENGNKLSGAEFHLYSKTGIVIATAVSDANGLAEFNNVPADTGYTIAETKAPEGYELNSSVISFSAAAATPLTFTVINKKQAPKTGSISILKTNESGAVLAGAEFTLYDAGGQPVQTVVTKPDGTAEFNNVPEGSYTITETRAPLGFIASAGSVSVNVTSGSTQSLTFINKTATTSETGKLQIVKVDKDYHPLAGAEFTLYDKDGNTLAKKTSGSDGMVVFDGLAPGRYSVKETAAPQGYVLFTDPMEFEINSSTTTLSFTLKDLAKDDDSDVAGWTEDNPNDDSGNNNQGGTLPKTGGIPDTLFILLAGMFLILSGLIAARPKTKHKKR
ncbi:MAG: SpaA isopeptide-forming pilin-related protein [Oscillospiraceae bacterium]|nr:SpaA isopeptide-forming pilin-related protein [Oscillospiraceae bacterium]